MAKIINWLKSVFSIEKNSVSRFIRRYSEFLTIPLAMLLWNVANRYYLEAKITTIYDNGIFQSLIWTVIALLVIKAFAWILLMIDDPYQKKLMDSENETFKKLPILWQYIFAYSKYLLYFVSGVFIVVLS